VAFSSSEYVLRLAVLIAATPVLVRRLGAEDYGLWMLVNTVVASSVLATFGVSEATIKFVSSFRASENRAGVVQTGRTAMTLGAAFGVIGAGVWLVLSQWVIGLSWIQMQAGHEAVALLALRLGALGVFLAALEGVVDGTLQGYERYDTSAKINVGTHVATMGAITVAVLLGGGLICVVATCLGGQLVGIVGKTVFVVKFTGTAQTLLPTVRMSLAGRLMGFGISAWLQGVSGFLSNHLDRLLVAGVLSPAALSYYTVCLQLAQQTHALLAKASAFLFPMFSGLWERDDHGGAKEVYFRAMRIVSMGSVCLSIPLILLANSVLTIWMGVAFAATASGTLRILAFVYAVSATSVPVYHAYNGRGRVGLNAAFSMSSGVLTAVATACLVAPFGVMGAAVAKIASFPVMIVSRTVLHRQVLGCGRWYNGASTVLPALVPSLAAVAWAARFPEPTTMLWQGTMATLAVVIAVTAAFVISREVVERGAELHSCRT
jgi:O-antigen/teichoic acid export membrane protein